MEQHDVDIFIEGVRAGARLAGSSIPYTVGTPSIMKVKRGYRKFKGSNLTPWSSEEEELIRNNTDKSVKELTKMLPGRTMGAVYQKRKLLGATRSKKDIKNYGGLVNLGQLEKE